jgi:hypothetical protein
MNKFSTFPLSSHSVSIIIFQDNHLSSLSGGGLLSDLSLITHLNLASNAFTALPKEIGDCLTNLKVISSS